MSDLHSPRIKKFTGINLSCLTHFLRLCLFAFLVTGLYSAVIGQTISDAKDSDEKAATARIKVLIVDGQNNHDAWPKSTIMMKSYLEESGLFKVDIQRTKYTWKGKRFADEFPLDDGKTYEDLRQAKADPDFKPEWSDYQVVVSNFGHGAADWPESTKTSFVEYMKNGGGFVSVHAADNSFPGWKEYNEMIGLGGWGGRSEKSGPYVYYNDKNEVVRDESAGSGGGHGPQHEFSLVVRNEDHPITKGLPSEFMHTKDELYERLRGPAINMNVLATAYASPKFKGSGRHEPALMTIDFGKGRCFHTTLGHTDYSFECAGFITVFLRGTQWAATGEVTIPVPKDFPTADKTSPRKFEPAKKSDSANDSAKRNTNSK